MKSMVILQSLTVVALAYGQEVKPTPNPAPAPAATEAATKAASPRPIAPPAKMGHPQAAASPAPVAEDKVLGGIGKHLIRESDFEAFLSFRYQPQQLAQLRSMPEVKERLRNEYLDSVVIAAKARKEGLDKTEDYKKNLAFLEMQALIKDYMQKENAELMKERQVSDEEIKAFYDANAASFKTQDTFSARHILVKVKGGTNGAQGLSDEEAKAKILKAKAELAAGRSWNEVAKEYSEDPGSKDKGGLYENKHFGEFVKEFDAAVKTQPLGQPGEPVKSQFGYHLIQVEKLNKGEIPPMDKIKEQVRQKALAKKSEQVLKDFFNGLKKEVGFVEGEAAAKAAGHTPAHHAKKKTSEQAAAETK